MIVCLKLALASPTVHLLNEEVRAIPLPIRHGRGGALYGPPPHNPNWKWYQTIPLYKIIYLKFFPF